MGITATATVEKQPFDWDIIVLPAGVADYTNDFFRIGTSDAEVVEGFVTSPVVITLDVGRAVKNTGNIFAKVTHPVNDRRFSQDDAVQVTRRADLSFTDPVVEVGAVTETGSLPAS